MMIDFLTFTNRINARPLRRYRITIARRRAVVELKTRLAFIAGHRVVIRQCQLSIGWCAQFLTSNP